MRSLAYTGLVVVCCTLGFAQSQNVNLVANVDNYPTLGYSDCWGYTAPNGSEYALLGVNTGVSVVDVTDTTNIVEVDFIPFVTAPPLGWYDIKTYQNYMYVSSEGSFSILIVDLSTLPDSASVAGSFSGSSSGIHNIFIDTTMAILYVIDAGNLNPSVLIFSLADPINPVQLSTIHPGNNGTDSHDAFAQDSVLYVAEGTSPSVGIFDVSDPANPLLLNRLNIPAAGYVHHVWVTEDNNYMVTTEETPAKTVKVWDIQDINNILLVSEYLGGNLLAHNAYFEGDLVYISHFESGLKILDFSDPAAVVEVGSYDTYPQGESPNFRGAWGVYPFTQNGMIFVSDIQTGLYVLQFEREGPQILVLPSSIDFGKVEVGTTSDPQTVTVRSFGTENLVVTDILNPGASFILSGVPTLPVTIPRGGSETFNVTFSPAGAGDLADSIVVSSNDSTNPTLAIPLSGRGVVIGEAHAGVMYATSAAPTSQLYTINTATGAATPIGATGISDIQGLAIRPISKELFGVVTSASNTTLYRVSIEQGDALFAATIPIGNMQTIVFSGGDTLYGGSLTGSLYRIDVSTGDTAFVGSAQGVAYSGLSFSPNTSVLWGSVRGFIGRDRIYTVNTSNGDTTLVGRTGDNQDTQSISFSPFGTLYGLKGVGAQTNTLILIDTINALGTTVGSTGVSGLLAITMRTDSIVVSINEQAPATVPESYVLAQNYPNPFNPSTQIEFALPKASHVKLEIYNVMGELITTLVDGTRQAGHYSARFDATGLASGLYFYRLQAGEFVDTKKLLLLK